MALAVNAILSNKYQQYMKNNCDSLRLFLSSKNLRKINKKKSGSRNGTKLEEDIMRVDRGTWVDNKNVYCLLRTTML